MGVYIPNMDMPKNCFQCSFNDGIYCALIDNDTDALIFEDPTEVSTKRLDDCPLIEIDLVRCGECRWCDDKGKGRALICTNPYIDMDIHPSYFCPYGERRTDGDI